jgi:5-methyltetrahydropteroyltriglutamate--homocysteine methyltransferase
MSSIASSIASRVPSSRPPFRADHVGSLLRPKALRDAFRKRASGEMDEQAFATAQDAAIRDVVKLQEDAGLGVVTDGEFRRASYWGRFIERCQGFAIKPALFKFRDDHGHEMDFTATYAQARVARTRALAVDEYEFVSGVTMKAAKITLPAPSTMHLYRYADFANPAVYSDAAAFFADLSNVFREEIAALAAAGCRYIQLDEVAIALLCDDGIRARLIAEKQDPDAFIGLYIKSINDAVAGAPADMAIGVHMCRGNFKGHYLSQGGYESVAERFFNETLVTHFLLEYDTPRAGDFAPLRFMPKGKGVVLGLVSSKTAALESQADLRRRIDEAARVMDLDRLGIGPQCGFASTVAGNPLTDADQAAKLKLVVDTARAVWGTV